MEKSEEQKGKDDEEDREEETDEEKIHRLGEEVQDLQNEMERILSNSPPIARPVPEPLLKLRREIQEKDTERELLLEDQRASKVVEEYLEENAAILEKAEECPICLEPIFDVAGAGIFMCCGCTTCGSCWEPLKSMANKTCPLCRGRFPPKSEHLRIFSLKAAAGKAWAQCSLGNEYYYGLTGLAVDKQKARSLYRTAADQGYSHAYYQLGLLEGARGNYSEAFRLFEAAASQGHMNALGRLGMHYWTGEGVEQDDVKAVRVMTISTKLVQATQSNVHQMLAECFAIGVGGLEQSLIRSLYYMKPAIEESELPPSAMVFYAKLLWGLSGSQIAPSGDNSVPEALFWYRRAHAESMDAESVQLLDSAESSVKTFCACCYKALSTDKPKCCVECRAVCYCSRECQAADWKAGHKKDCVKSLKKRLRATGLPEYTLS